MIATRERNKFYNINENSVGVVAGAFLEEGDTGDVKRRINPADPYPEGRIEKDRWDYNEHSEVEREATINAFGLAKRGDNLIVWISPEDGKVYQEGRLNVYLPVNENGEWKLLGRGIPLKRNRQESWELAQRLLGSGGQSMDPIYDAEGVRKQPIGFKIGRQGDWIGWCKKLMPEFEELWNFVERGGEIENKRRMERDVMAAMAVARGDNRVFEMTMARMGNMINRLGGHGSSWLGGDNSVYRFEVVMVNGEVVVDKIRKGIKWVCPLCGAEVGEGVTVCVKCGAKMK